MIILCSVYLIFFAFRPNNRHTDRLIADDRRDHFRFTEHFALDDPVFGEPDALSERVLTRRNSNATQLFHENRFSLENTRRDT